MPFGLKSSRSRRLIARLGTACVLASVLAIGASAHDEPGLKPHHISAPMNPTATMRAFMEGKLGDTVGVQALATESDVSCNGVSAGDYHCSGVDLLAFMPLGDIGLVASNDEGNDIWGWTDPVSRRDYAIMGRVFGTSFVDITDPINPVYLGDLPTHGVFGSPWRDIKVFDNHAFIVSEALNHGMQVFDLTQLPLLDPAGAPFDFTETAHYDGFGSAHNIVINEDSGYAYAVGTNQCSGGLEMVDISSPALPTDAGCFSTDGYTHDAQCVDYSGPDTDYTDKEICFASNEDTLTIVDVSVKAAPDQIARIGYDGFGYTHQGWLNEGQTRFYLDDELDELNSDPTHNTRTRVWDVSDLDNPTVIAAVDSTTAAIDHNLYVKENSVYQANYRAGLRILDAGQAAAGIFDEIGYFDIFPFPDDANADHDGAEFNGAWSNYPYFDGVVIVSGIEQGLFVLQPNNEDFVTFLSPGNDSIVSGSAVPIAIRVNDSDGDLVLVEWEVDGDGPLPTTPPAGAGDPYTAMWNTTLETPGVHKLTAVMTDAATNVTTRAFFVIVDDGVDPVVSNIMPASGDVSGVVTLSAMVTDDLVVASVEFFDGADKIGDGVFVGGDTWEVDWNTRREDTGPHTILVRATDTGANIGEGSVDLTVVKGGGGGSCPPNGNKPGC